MCFFNWISLSFVFVEKNNDKNLRVTADGSHTLFVSELDEHYHSINGAVQESMHVFIRAGLDQVEAEHIHILEIGFGTGLNAFLTLREIEKANNPQTVEYHSVERYPLASSLIHQLNYARQAWPEQEALFEQLHTAPWEESVPITPCFTLHKIEGNACNCTFPSPIDLIYFDAFAPEKQPELWEQPMFDRLFACTASGGIIVTYCAKGEVRRRMQAAGFRMERLPGPPGKRHMLFGRKG